MCEHRRSRAHPRCKVVCSHRSFAFDAVVFSVIAPFAISCATPKSHSRLKLAFYGKRIHGETRVNGDCHAMYFWRLFSIETSTAHATAVPKHS